MNRNLLNMLLGIIKKSNQDLAPVRNLLGVPVSELQTSLGEETTQHWKIYSLPDVIQAVPLSPDEIMNQISTLQAVTAPILTAVQGILVFPITGGTTLATTIVNVPHSVSIRVEVDAPGRQIAIYSHETLVQRGSNNIVTFVPFTAGKTALNVVIQGSQANNIVINLPPDINTDFTAFAP